MNRGVYPGIGPVRLPTYGSIDDLTHPMWDNLRYNYEFDSPTLTTEAPPGWKRYNSALYRESNGFGTLYDLGTSGDNHRVMSRPLPVLPFVVTAKMMFQLSETDYSQAGFGMMVASSGKTRTAGQGPGGRFRSESFANFGSGGSGAQDNGNYYWQQRCVGRYNYWRIWATSMSAVNYEMSIDGNQWFRCNLAGALDMASDQSNLTSDLGIALNSNNGYYTAVGIDWWRETILTGSAPV